MAELTAEALKRLEQTIVDLEGDEELAWFRQVGVSRSATRLGLVADLRVALAEIARLRSRLNTPELHDFAAAVVLEAAHQRERWGSEHDAGKEPEDWFWLLGYLGGKALASARAGDADKALHHTISSAAALANWHAALSGANTDMRPGIDPVLASISQGREG